MVHRKKTTPLQESEGEDFGDDSDDSTSSNSKVGGIEDLVEDDWVFPIVRPNAKRAEYEAVCSTKVFDVELTIVSVDRRSKMPNSK